MTHEEAMQSADADGCATLDQSRLDLDQGHVALLGNQIPNEAAMRLDPAGMSVAATRLGHGLTVLQCKLPPANRARSADTEAISRSPATQSIINRSDDPIPKVL